MVFMSVACGLWFLRAMAAKNCASEGYTQFPSESFGMEDVSRAVERVGVVVVVVVVWTVDGGVGVVLEVEKGRKRDQEDCGVWSTGQLSALGCWTGHFDIFGRAGQVRSETSILKGRTNGWSGTSSRRNILFEMHRTYRMIITRVLQRFAIDTPELDSSGEIGTSTQDDRKMARPQREQVHDSSFTRGVGRLLEHP